MASTPRRALLLAVVAVWLASACGSSSDGARVSERMLVPGGGPTPSTSVVATTVSPPVVTVRYRLERRTTDRATGDFDQVVRSTLEDARGWTRAGFALVAYPAGEFRIVLAEGPEVHRLCLPYDTYGLYSCQNGPVVALNADRWRHATPQWTGDLATYRAMLVNHEVGHLLGLKPPRCSARRPARRRR